jgi:peptide deformylase
MKIDPKYLHQSIPEISFNSSVANQQLAQLLIRYMNQNRAVGLAANQVGYQKRLFVMNTNGIVRQCFNPEILDVSQDLDIAVEGCLSYPRSWIEVARPRYINVKYYDYRGQPQLEKLEGLSARCYCHELDHLDGITMLQRHKEQKDVSPEPRN